MWLHGNNESYQQGSVGLNPHYGNEERVECAIKTGSLAIDITYDK